MKKLVMMISLLVICLGWSGNSFALTKLYETSTKEVVNSGTNLIKYKRLTDKGWLAINMLEVNLKDKNTTVRVLTSANGLHTFQSVKTMLANEKNGIAAINADFFTGNYQKGNSIGLTIREGEMLTSTYYENEIKDTLASFVLNEKDEVVFDYFTNRMMLKDTKSEAEILVSEMNKWSSNYEYAVLYNHEWGEKSVELEGLTELVVKKGKVVEVRVNEEAASIPKDGFVISALGAIAETLQQKFHKGDNVVLSTEIGLDIEKVKVAVSGGAILVKEGKIPSFSHVIYGANPRTAIGLSKDGKTLYLITVDGRQAASIGVTQDELAEILIEKGIYQAMNLDGGGSTSMVTRELGEEAYTIENSPSDGTLRMVPNAIAVLNTEKTGKLENLIVETDDVNVFVGCQKELKVKGYDKYYNPVTINSSKIKWSMTGVPVEVHNNILTAGKEAGTVTLTASVGKAKGTISLDILSIPNEVEITPKMAEITTNDTVTYQLKAYNKNGYIGALHASEVEWKIDTANVMIKDGVFSSRRPGSYVVEVSVGNAKAYAFVMVKGENTSGEVDNIVIKELPFDVKGIDIDCVSGETKEKNDFCIAVVPMFYEGTLLERLKNHKVAQKVEQEAQMVLYPFEKEETLTNISVKIIADERYQVFHEDNVTVICVDMAKGGIRISDSNQWLSIMNDVPKAKKNVIVVLNGNLEDFQDKAEKDLWIDVLCELKRNTGKNIWVVQTGDHTEYAMRRGVKYLTIASPQFKEGTLKEFQSVEYFLITAGQDKMTYEIKKVF